MVKISKYVRTEYPTFNWSNARKNIFDSECKRAYYYHYYKSHNGWEKDSDELSRQAYKLKKLTNIYIITGAYLHEACKAAIDELRFSKNELLDSNSLDTYIFNKLKEAINSSKNRADFEKRPNKNIMLYSYYYKKGLTDDKKEKIANMVRMCTENFFESKTFDQIYSEDIKIIEVDENKFDTIDFEGIKIAAKLDVLIKNLKDKYVIVDWKSGKASLSDKEQMRVYVMYVSQKYKIPISKIITRIEYLQTAETGEFTYTSEDISLLKDELRENIKEMQNYLEDKSLNKPLPMEQFKQVIDSNCFKCNYLEICKMDIEKELNMQF